MIWPECACVVSGSLTTLAVLNECSSVNITVGYQLSPWLRLRSLWCINARVIDSGFCGGIISNAITLSLLAIASPKRIREISDGPNWKITIKGGGRAAVNTSWYHFLFLQWHWFDLVLASVQQTEVGLRNLWKIPSNLCFWSFFLIWES